MFGSVLIFSEDTAAAIGYSALIIEHRFREHKDKIEVVVLASDHLIQKSAEFREILKLAAEEANKNSVIVTLGIKPDRPETGYGYIEVNGDSITLNTVHKVKRFREKPNLETAEDYVASGRYIWNSGMFIFALETIFNNYQVLLEDHSSVFKQLRPIIANGAIGVELSQLAAPHFQHFEKISVDFGIMEYSRNIRVIPVDIGWSDIGSFTALAEVFPADANGNVVRDTTVISQDSSSNIVIAKDCLVSLLGVEHLVVVKNGQNILIAHRDKAQDIKKIVSKYNALQK